MKKFHLLLLFSFFLSQLFAQQIALNEDKILVEKRLVDAWVCPINANVDLVRKSFIQFAKDKYTLKAKKKSGRSLLIAEANIPSISARQGDLWVVFYPVNDSIRMGVSFLFGYDIVVNSQDYPAEMSRLNSFVREFLIYYKSEYFNTLIAEDRERIKALSDELKKNEKELRSLTRSVSKVEKSISKSSDESVKFELNNKSIETKANIQAKHDVIMNLKEEISKVTLSLNAIRNSLKRFEVENLDDINLDEEILD